jgi:hypothetical protein
MMTTIEQLVAAYIEAKRDEEDATAHRIAIGEELAARLEHPAEGSKTHSVGEMKVTLKGVINRRVDWAAFEQITEANPNIHPPVRHKPELDVRGLHWLAENAPDYYRALCPAITSTPGRTGIEIKKP